MIDEKDIKLIIETVWSVLTNIQEMVTNSYKPEYEETIYFPFGQHIDKSRASMIINIKYRESADFIGSRIIISIE